ncbi:DUF4129 domain-containing protein [Crocosphaera sp. XPORK-15E]|uniref:DUF4129 domain-containing protein n=1 Tax=Crocosphaera sp. XPORK-15E TaxID=3110247 RepID=UPI002B1ECB57|nr:DUF4129 domain-containing protein [Crocosphaera sp. XPORK-15E]MEA5535163.1 DUF4129 domain-containing protein [Crocosphaera sp. XPORK-15E]
MIFIKAMITVNSLILADSSQGFEKDSIGWQFQQRQQQMGEWFELQFKNLNFNFPDNPLPNLEIASFWGELIKNITIIFFLLILGWFGWKIIQRITPYIQSFLSDSHATLSQKKSEIQKLSSEKLWQKAQQCQQKGDYYQGCRYLYLAMLQRLDETQIATHQESRTDEEYRLLILKLPDPDPYETLLGIHQQLCFRDKTASRSLFETCQQAYQRIEL